MGGKQVDILCTMTSDSVKANSYLFGNKINGELHFVQVFIEITDLGFTDWVFGFEAQNRLEPEAKNHLFCGFNYF